MSFEGPVEDRLALRELLDSYSIAVLRQDPAAWSALWAEDAVWHFGSTTVLGRESITGLWRKAMADFVITGFAQMPGTLCVAGDAAEGECQTIERLVRHDGHVRAIWGANNDRFVRRGGCWLLSERRYRIVHEMTA